MEERPEEFLGDLRLGRQLSTAAQVSAGGMITVLGLIFMVGGPTVLNIGPAGALAGLLAGLAMGLTAMNVLELLGGSGEHGGLSHLVQETLGGLAGHLTGWAVLAGEVVLAAGMAKVAASYINLLLPDLGLPSMWVGVALFAAIVLFQLLRPAALQRWLWAAFLLLLAGLVVVVLSTTPNLSLNNLRAGAPIPPGAFLRGTAWLSLMYAGLEIVLSSRRQSTNPSRLAPPALMWTLVFGVGIFLLVDLTLSAFRQAGLITLETALISLLGRGSLLPSWIPALVGAAALLLATHRLAITSARQIYSLVRQGTLPEFLRSLPPLFRVPPLLFLFLLLIGTPAVIWAPTRWLIDLPAALFLFSALMLNLAGIISRRTQPERRRTFSTPFHPLIPALGMALNLTLLLALPGYPLAVAFLWLVAGALVYLIYGRTHLIDAQEGLLVFGRERSQEKKEGVYRILVPISPGVERRVTLDVAAAIAGQLGGDIVPLQIITIADPLAINEGRRLAQERNTLFQWSVRMASNSGVPIHPITRLAHSVSRGILDTAAEENCDLILMPWRVQDATRDVRMGHVLDPVVRQAPCDVAVIALPAQDTSLEGLAEESTNLRERPSLKIGRILVPTSGGPHAPLATRLGLVLAKEYGATVEAVYVTHPGAGEQEQQQGKRRIARTLEAMRERARDIRDKEGGGLELESVPIRSRLVEDESVLDGIVHAGAEVDLVLLGASEESVIDQMLFGTLPEQVAQRCPTPVMMVKHYRGLPRFWLQRLWDTVYGALPTLSPAEQVEVYRQVRRGARPDVDFFVMMGLSAVIATFGLQLGSSAVIIGAMLVAPLFTPILAFSLAIVQGDIRLLRLAVEAALKGIALAVGLSIVLTALSPLRILTPEIMSRIHPNLFDLAVALASGAAGAYAIAREDVAAALPGVAIAAALIPPLSVAGVGLAIADLSIAGGGGLLFITNLIAITLAGSITLLLLGFRPTERGERAVRLRLGLSASVILLIVISIPLALVFVQTVQESRMRQSIDRVLTMDLTSRPGISLANFDFETQGDTVDVTATVQTQHDLQQGTAADLRDSLSQALGRPVSLRIITIPVVELTVP
jgi:uncharacterized hydrophobic protein (TIGR00271 family)